MRTTWLLLSYERCVAVTWHLAHKLDNVVWTVPKSGNIITYSSESRTHRYVRTNKKATLQSREAERKTNRKLGFYNSIKETFGCETYLNIGLSYQEQKRLAQFRTSSHRYKAETGRYKQKHESVSVINRICEYCSPNSEVIVNLSALPFFEPIIEDEKHVLFECPQYEKERLQLNQVEKEPIK